MMRLWCVLYRNFFFQLVRLLLGQCLLPLLSNVCFRFVKTLGLRRKIFCGSGMVWMVGRSFLTARPNGFGQLLASISVSRRGVQLSVAEVPVHAFQLTQWFHYVLLDIHQLMNFE